MDMPLFLHFENIEQVMLVKQQEYGSDIRDSSGYARNRHSKSAGGGKNEDELEVLSLKQICELYCCSDTNFELGGSANQNVFTFAHDHSKVFNIECKKITY